jgi:putative phosphoribosyl transferase
MVKDNKTLGKEARESGQPGGGAGRKDDVGRSGVYPTSGPYPEGSAEFRGQASWGQGERGASGYHDHGNSELFYRDGQLLGAYDPEDRKKQALHVQIPAGAVVLEGDMHVPERTRGMVLFAHGSGSSRNSPRNQLVARALEDSGFATLLFDLLTESEEKLDTTTAQLRFNVGLLANRLVDATEWARQQEGMDRITFGYFGASTGAAAALVAASRVHEIAAVVSRGGRPDLAGSALSQISIPVLLIVGSEDHEVLKLNRQAAAQLKGKTRLETIPGATHLFEEPGALERVALAARRWFERFLSQRDGGVQAA